MTGPDPAARAVAVARLAGLAPSNGTGIPTGPGMPDARAVRSVDWEHREVWFVARDFPVGPRRSAFLSLYLGIDTDAVGIAPSPPGYAGDPPGRQAVWDNPVAACLAISQGVGGDDDPVHTTAALLVIEAWAARRGLPTPTDAEYAGAELIVAFAPDPTPSWSL